MTPRAIGFILLGVAVFVGGLAHLVGLDGLATTAIVATIALVGLSIAVSLSARERLAANRAALMRDAKMCPKCGYFIRVETDRCPECGTPVANGVVAGASGT